jgi:hypothetical protein
VQQTPASFKFIIFVWREKSLLFYLRGISGLSDPGASVASLNIAAQKASLAGHTAMHW